MVLQHRLRALKLTAVATTVGVIGVLPMMMSSYSLSVLAGVIPFALAVLGMNLLTGMNGQISIGHSAFFGIGAYGTAILIESLGWSYLLAGLGGLVLSVAAGVVVGVPALRLRGLYVAITTLGIALAFPGLVRKFEGVTGGSEGLYMINSFAPPSWLSVLPEYWTFYVSAALLGAGLIVVRNLRYSRFGRSILAISDHDVVAETFGVQIAQTKIVTFAVSAGLAGLGGVVFLLQQQFLAPESFGLVLSVNFFVGMAIGGAYSIYGAIFGGFFLQFAPLISQDFGIDPVLTPALYGALLIILMLGFRNGVAGGINNLTAAISRKLTRRRAIPSDSGLNLATESLGAQK